MKNFPRLPIQAIFTLFVLLSSVVTTAAWAQEATPTEDGANTALIEALEDPEQRARLIEALRDSEGGGVDDAAPAEQDEQTVAEQAAEISRDLVVSLIDNGQRILNDFGRLALLPKLLTPDRREAILAELWPLLWTMLTTLGGYYLFRAIGRRIRAGVYKETDTFGQKTRAFVVQILSRLVAVVIAVFMGYGLGALFFSTDELNVSQAAFLNAFTVFGLASIALALFVSSDERDITFSRLPLEVEKTVFKTVRWVFGILAYGLIAVVPISQIWVNFVLARSLRTIVLTLAAVAAFWAIYRISRAIRRQKETETPPLEDAEEETVHDTVAASTIGLWDRIWPALATVYVLISFLIALSNPNQMVEMIGRATAFSALGLGALVFALRILAHVGDRPTIWLPSSLTALLPPLQARLSAFVPASMIFAAVVLIGLAISLFLGGWGIIDIATWYSNTGSDLVWRIASFVLIAVALIVLWSSLTSWIDTRLSEDLSGAHVTARSRTLLALFKNVLTIALVVFGGMTALSELGIDIAPLLAGAGVIGLAIGFGAQKLVQDIITGIFIQLENAINEGEVITVAGITGAVERLTIRSVGLRDVAGVYHLIPFSAVDTVSNFMRGFGYHVEVVGVAYESDLDDAKEAMHKAFDTLNAGPMGADILGSLEWHGVVGLGDSSVNLRARVKTKPGQQWAIGRAYTEQVKREFDAAGVEIPFPHRELRLSTDLIQTIGGKKPQ